MGMSASQARLLNLQARQSNLEYQGQQINQERSILSQQASTLTTSLLDLQIPTPPSTSDYTTITYSGTDGASTFTIGMVKPSGDKYIVEMQYTQTGSTIEQTYDKATVTKEDDGTIKISGCKAYTFEELESVLNNDSEYAGYLTAFKNSEYDTTQFYAYIEKNSEDKNEVKFVQKQDVEGKDNLAQVYTYKADGKYNVSEELDSCDLVFDPGTGRIKTLMYPIKDTEGNIIGEKSINLESKKTTDEAAYKDAMAEYEYAQYQYDKEQQEINAKTEIIQREDRNLELKLQRLDNERTQITTEIEALETVIKDNIEASYKTFSG